jgi:hypothetical protein
MPLVIKNMLGPYPQAYLHALNGSVRQFARKLLGLKSRPQVPVLSLTLDQILERHSWICEIVRNKFPSPVQWKGHAVCEAGAGDCLAAASLMLGLGASYVTIVEHEPLVDGAKQAAVLLELKKRGFPCELDILTSNNKLNTDKCRYIRSYMEHYRGEQSCSLVYSICVGEHVEDLGAFFASCRTTLTPKGSMVHYIDLGGHGIFEDPLPPLEFHRYSDLVYGAIYPPYHRATRRFIGDYIKAAEEAGFTDVQVTPIRTADNAYIKAVRPFLKSRARQIHDSDLAVIEFVITGLIS